MMPWGWRHAYLNDPDGHEISLCWAGENRMKKTVMRPSKKLPGLTAGISETDGCLPIRRLHCPQRTSVEKIRPEVF